MTAKLRPRASDAPRLRHARGTARGALIGERTPAPRCRATLIAASRHHVVRLAGPLWARGRPAPFRREVPAVTGGMPKLAELGLDAPG
jgi:hypothetical protein